MNKIRTMAGPDDFLSERGAYIYTQRESGKKYREISQVVGVTVPRVREVYRRCVRRLTVPTDWKHRLSARACNVLFHQNLHTIKEVSESIKNGNLNPRRARNYGKKTHDELIRVINEIKQVNNSPK